MLSYFKNLIIIFSLILFTAGCVHKFEVHAPSKQPAPRKIENVEVALVLGGGGAKAIAQLGAIEVLEKNGIPVDLIVGTSAGSLIGAMYADNPNYLAIRKKLDPLKKWDLIDLSFPAPFKSVAKGSYLQKFIHDNLRSKNIEDLPIPFIAVATSMNTNKAYLFRAGPIAPAVYASSALPMAFAPIKLYDNILFDGGAAAPVPVGIARQFKPKMVIAIDISARPDNDMPSNALTITYKALCISYYELSRMQAATADIDIHPNLSGFGMFEDNRKEELYNLGKQAAQAKIKDILKMMKKRGIKQKLPNTVP
jgi:NTE family protein